MMSDGPYREQALVPLAGPKPIVLAGEKPSPSPRLEIVDYSDGGTIVRLRGVQNHDRPTRYFLYGVMAFACVAAVEVLSPAPLVVSAYAAGILWLPKLFGRGAIEEMSIGPNGIAWQCGTRHGLVGLDTVDRFEVRDGALSLEPLRDPLNAGSSLEERSELHFETPQALDPHELKWLAGRLNRALDRVKR